ncbi:MAG: Lipoprotein signal peptidase [Pelotomaculum sp. PtaU1.Bin035]|nr:signal peptidase II [Pelotomaculum sp. PtaB.Bin117]OPX86125.1 MAG: Lipoprotein signal peptidase [Pelotomaculum sp. PtaB.Bin117]OPY59544.1 MAG: Lipoprotein signal peptidase [Pelotomaculum sp. PtaU1.Bin035]
MFMFFAVIIITFLLDQVSKAIVQMLMYHGESIPLVPHVFNLTYILNPGAAFGLLAYQTSLFVAITVILTAGVLFGYRRLPLERHLLRYGLGLIVGGALGNLLDRLRYGFVIDFLDFHVWPVFNLADTAIVMGACFLVWDLFSSSDHKPKKERGL